MTNDRHRLTEDQRRTVIITAALRVFESEGIFAVNHGNVAKRCTIPTSKATVRFYFKARSDLWAAIAAADESGLAAEAVSAAGGLG